MAKAKKVSYKELSNDIHELTQEMLRGGGMGRLYRKISPFVQDLGDYHRTPT